MKASSWERVEALRRVEPTGPRILLGSEEYVESKQVALSLALGFLVGGCLGWVAGMLGAFALGYLDPIELVAGFCALVFLGLLLRAAVAGWHYFDAWRIRRRRRKLSAEMKQALRDAIKKEADDFDRVRRKPWTPIPPRVN